MYAICISHARKDHQKKSGEKAEGGGGANSENVAARGRDIKALYKDTQTEAKSNVKGHTAE